MRSYILAVLLTTLAAPVAANDERLKLEQRLEQLRNEAQALRLSTPTRDWDATRYYRSSTEHLRVIITTTRPVTIQCAAMDSAGEPLAIGRRYTIQPPMDEVIVRDFGKSSSVRCWER